MDEDIDPENLSEFSIPEGMLTQLFEFTGDVDHSKGFILAFVTHKGKPLVYTRTQNQIVEMGLRKALEKYLIGIEDAEGMEHMDNEDPEMGLD
jgi:hypothetical protein